MTIAIAHNDNRTRIDAEGFNHFDAWPVTSRDAGTVRVVIGSGDEGRIVLTLTAHELACLLETIDSVTTR